MSSEPHTLHWSPRSPFVKKIDIAAYELGLAGELRRVRSVVPTDDHNAPIFEDNPLGRIPALVTPSGEVFHGSSTILEYLDHWSEELGNPSGLKLFPDLPKDRLAVRQVETLCDGIMEILMNWLIQWWLPSGKTTTLLSNARNKIERSFEQLETDIDAINAGGVNAAGISLAVALSYTDFRFTRIIDWKSTHPKLAKWHDGWKQRPSLLNHPFAEG